MVTGNNLLSEKMGKLVDYRDHLLFFKLVIANFASV